MESIREQLVTPILGEYDIIVAGGGIAGVSAAVAAKRAGAEKVLLLEKTILFGGLATQGLIALYEPLDNGKGKKITYGMSGELMKLSMKYGPDTLPEVWRDDPDKIEKEKIRYKAFFSPTMFALALDEFVADAGVEVLFDTQVVRPVMDGKVCLGLVVENKSGRGFYRAKAVIDATGDADILYRAGVPCVVGKNFMTYVYYKTSLEFAEMAVKNRNIIQNRLWYTLGSGPKGDGHPDWAPMLSGTTTQEITDFVRMGRKMLMNELRNEDRWSRDVSILPTIPQLRTTRHIAGAYAVQESDLNCRIEDSVGIIADFLEEDKWYEVPYRALYHAEYPNLWTAGRSAAADGWAWVVLRVIPGAACTGQAAGVAAALSIKRQETAAELPYSVLRDVLHGQGVRMHVE